VPASLPAVGLALLVAGSLLFNSMIQTLVPSLNLLGRAGTFAMLSSGGLLLNLILSFVFVRAGGSSALLWLAGAIVGQALLMPVAYAAFFRGIPSRSRWILISPPQLKALFTFGWPVVIAVGLGWAQLQGYRFLIANESGLAALGLFSAGYGLAAALMSALEQILTTWFQPAFYRAAASSDPRVHAAAWERYAQVMLPLSLIGTLALVAIAPDFVALMLGPAFQSVTIYTVLAAAAECARVWVGVFTLSAHIQLRTRLLLIPNAIGTALTLALMLVLLPVFGLLVAPLSVTAGGLVICAFLYRTAVAKQGVRLPIRPLTLAIAASVAAILTTALARSFLVPSSAAGHPIMIALVAAIFGPLGWYFMRLARSESDVATPDAIGVIAGRT
jgi:O-antigen/teichoic acid export membrane protein